MRERRESRDRREKRENKYRREHREEIYYISEIDKQANNGKNANLCCESMFEG